MKACKMGKKRERESFHERMSRTVKMRRGLRRSTERAIARGKKRKSSPKSASGCGPVKDVTDPNNVICFEDENDRVEMWRTTDELTEP